VQFDLDTLPESTEVTVQNSNGDETDSDGDPTTGLVPAVTLAGGEEDLTLDLGIVVLITEVNLLIDKNAIGQTDDTAVWQLDVLNAGPGIATDGVQVVDPLPEELAFVSVTAPEGVTCSVVDEVVTCVHAADLPPGEGFSIEITTGLPPVGVEAVNGAVVSRVSGGEITLVDNEDTDTVEVEAPELAVTGASRTQALLSLGIGLILVGLLAFVAMDLVRRRQRLRF